MLAYLKDHKWTLLFLAVVFCFALVHSLAHALQQASTSTIGLRQLTTVPPAPVFASTGSDEKEARKVADFSSIDSTGDFAIT